jgi:biotin synthase-like enzyme
MRETWFERAVFLSWFCAKGDCKFCYMSTQKNLIRNPRKARRTQESVLAEVFLCKKLGWKIEFLSGGYESFSQEEMLCFLKNIYAVWREKLWLNIGVLSREELEKYRKYIAGVCGAVECINPVIRKKVCPSKPLGEIEAMFKACDELKLKKAMTIILGIGESVADIGLLKEFIKKNSIDKITFYRLKPQKGTVFENKKPIGKDYYVRWVKETRDAFPRIQITVGSSLGHLDELHMLLKAGADAITKFPSIRLFNTSYAKQIESEARKAHRAFKGTLTKLPKIRLDEIDTLSISEELMEKVKLKVSDYLKSMKKHITRTSKHPQPEA